MIEPETTQEDVNDFLDNLRESGRVNMFGAAPYIEKEFDMPKTQAKKMLIVWMRTFNK